MSRRHYIAIASRHVFTMLLFLCASLAFAQGAGYWHTSGSQILDANGAAVRIAGINWYGFETADLVAHGLNAQDYKAILQTIKDNGYNTVRIPFSNQMVESPVVPGYVQYSNSGGLINTDLQGLNSLQILDAIITQAGKIGLRVILDNHRSEAGNSAEASGLWYTDAYPETSWINDWVALATRYKGNTTVIGMDLRNEPHNANSGGSCWSCSDPAHDWHLAASKAGNAILAVNPNLLIFVEGTDAIGSDYYFWGGQLEGVATAPVTLSVANQLVYSAHDYGPKESPQVWLNGATTYNSLASNWNTHWGYIAVQGIAPIWVGEFGTPNTDSDVQDTTSGSQGQWFSGLIQYLTANPEINWTYWALNGEDNYALLDSPYDSTPLNALKQQKLASIQFPLSGGTPITAPTFTLTGNPSAITAATSAGDFGDATNITQVTYSATLSNDTSVAITNASVTVALPAGAATISNSSTGTTGTCSASVAGYTCTFANIAPGSRGGVNITVVYPESSLNFGSGSSLSVAVSATAQANSISTLTASASTTINKRSTTPPVSETFLAALSPGSTVPYGTAALVNFSLSPTPSTAIPLTAFSASIDGSTPATVTSTEANSWQIQLGTLASGPHTISISMAATSGYAASAANLAITVASVAPTISYVSPPSASYGQSTTAIVSVTGIPGNGFAAPTGNVALSIDGATPIQTTISNGSARFAIGTGNAVGSHTLSFTYTGDTNYSPQTITSNYVVTPAPLVVTGNPASRAYGAPNPNFTGVITGVLNNDSITADFVSQASATTLPGTYSTGPNAIMPVLTDTKSRLGNYNVTLTPGTLTVTPPAATISWTPPAAIVYGTPLSLSQLNATSTPALTLTYSPPAGSILNAGDQTLNVSGVSSIVTTPVTASVDLVVQKASTATIVSAAATTTSPYTVTATVTSAQGGSVTGPVNFFDGGALIGSSALDAKGTATFVIPTLASGPHSFTATYPGDANNLLSTSSAVTVAGTSTGDFTLAALPATLTLGAGKTGVVTLTIAPINGIRGPLTLACSNLPANSTCTFSPTNLTLDGSANSQTSQVTIGLPPSAGLTSKRDLPHSHVLYAFLPCLLLGSLCIKRRKLTTIALCLLTATLGSGISGCGSGKTYANSDGAYVGNYNAIITATEGTVVHTMTIPVGLVQ